MQCIFVTVFHQEQYVQMFYLLLESIWIYGNLDDDTIILVYTSTPFMKKIKQSHLYNSQKILFEVNDTCDTIKKSCRARYTLFDLPSVQLFEKILYLDTDIVIQQDLNKVFAACQEDVLYVVEEGTITCESNFWGKFLFGKEIHKYKDNTGFTSAIMLFKNCEQIKTLFHDTVLCFRHENPGVTLNDQPYLVYTAFQSKLYNNKVLKAHVDNIRGTHLPYNKVIHHFPGGPGSHKTKIEKMRTVLNGMKNVTTANNMIKAIAYLKEHLLPLIRESGEMLEGNIFMVHHSFAFKNFNTYFKPKNISNVVLNTNIQHGMEIGFNAGFSALLMLLSNPKLILTCFDLGEHKYTRPCFLKLKETFGDRITIIFGDSTKTLQDMTDTTFDVIHIDGGHSVAVAESDIKHAYRMSKDRTILIMDDYDFPDLHTLWDRYVMTYNLKPLDIVVDPCPQHSIKYVKNKL